MISQIPLDKASEVEVGDNAVRVLGPDAVDVLLTPKAALETAKRISDAAVESIILHARAEDRITNQ